MFFPHFPLTLFFLFCLFFSFSYAHNKNHETPQCNCDCSSAHNNSHANIPTNPGQSSPAHNNSRENIPTNPGQSSPAHNNSHENIPIKPGNSSPVHDYSHEVPAKPGNSPPPIGCLPLHISLCPVKAALDHMGCAAAVNAAVMMHNQILAVELQGGTSNCIRCVAHLALFYQKLIDNIFGIQQIFSRSFIVNAHVLSCMSLYMW